ncbi:Uncharacterized protein TCM_023776 [Theobroma cacao]|uniref:Uncharacterized protein n=1 Tax=Theobroma cacao TaxID=3641 RepID=A0A061EVQ2_THECC|nr:Uncharacterized protein TCM_023776 [Theobroma cacao]
MHSRCNKKLLGVLTLSNFMVDHGSFNTKGLNAQSILAFNSCTLTQGHSAGRQKSFTKKDEMLQYKLEPIPFLEELVRKIKEGKKLLTMDIKRLLPFETNRIDFVNGVAAEAKEYFGSNQDEYGGMYFPCGKAWATHYILEKKHFFYLH